MQPTTSRLRVGAITAPSLRADRHHTATAWPGQLHHLPLLRRKPSTINQRRLTIAPAASTSTTTLQNPVRFGMSKATASFVVQDKGGDSSLGTYMRLPVEQYSELDPALIKSLGGNKFVLTVPKLSLLGAYVQPSVEVEVVLLEASGSKPPRLLLTSNHCRLKGSDIVQRMHLDERFTLHWTTELTWNTTSNETTTAVAMPPTGLLGQEVVATPGDNANASINAQLDLEVLTEVIPPFNLLPRHVLVGAAEATLRACTRSLLPMFVQRLAEDYQRWADDPVYRARRASSASQRH